MSWSLTLRIVAYVLYAVAVVTVLQAWGTLEGRFMQGVGQGAIFWILGSFASYRAKRLNMARSQDRIHPSG